MREGRPPAPGWSLGRADLGEGASSLGLLPRWLARPGSIAVGGVCPPSRHLSALDFGVPFLFFHLLRIKKTELILPRRERTIGF